ncbi:MAG: hypothetical protein C4555_00960 [Dehalococcoidia bacterium]|nr:MAG: hypothetical protein C4555_00960 [Dehalococcoidia bacterium]
MTEGPRLRPREHGAYAMLAFPATSGLVLGGASWAGAAFIGMALAGFLAHESVLVVLGARGARVQASLEE